MTRLSPGIRVTNQNPAYPIDGVITEPPSGATPTAGKVWVQWDDGVHCEESLPDVTILANVMTEDQFYAKYQSIPSQVGDNIGSEVMEWEEASTYPANQRWTWVDGDEGETMVVAGDHFVNRFGYLITTEPWENEAEEAVMDQVPDDDEPLPDHRYNPGWCAKCGGPEGKCEMDPDADTLLAPSGVPFAAIPNHPWEAPEPGAAYPAACARCGQISENWKHRPRLAGPEAAP